MNDIKAEYPDRKLNKGEDVLECFDLPALKRLGLQTKRVSVDFPQSIADDFAELRGLCEREDYSLEVPPRQNRPNPFTD